MIPAIPFPSQELLGAIAPDPPVVTPRASLRAAIARMAASGSTCVLVAEETTTPLAGPGRLAGILTQGDWVRLGSQALDLDQVTIATVMSHPVITRYKAEIEEVSDVLALFEAHQMGHLPLLDKDDRLVGLLSKDRLNEGLAQRRLPVEDAAPSQAKSELYEGVVSTTTEGIALIDRHYIYQVVNPIYLDWYAKQRAEIVGHPVSEILGEARFETVVRPRLDRCLAGQAQQYESWFNYQQGRRFMRVTYSPYVEMDGTITGVVVSLHNLTDLKQAEEALSAQNRLLEQVAKANPLPQILDTLLRSMELQLAEALCSIMLCDEGRLHSMPAPQLPNSYLAGIDGLRIGEGEGSCGTAAARRSPVIVPDIATDPLWRDYRDLALEYELRACWSVPILDSEGNLLGIFGVYHREIRAPKSEDLSTITWAANIAGIAIEREQATQSLEQINQALEDRVEERTADLHKSEQRYLSLAAAAPVAIFQFDKPLNCIYVNDRWSEMTGQPKESALGKGWIEALHPDDREVIIAQAQSRAALPSKPTLDRDEGRHLRPDGSINWFYVQVAKQLDANGQVIGAIGTLTDITNFKEAQMALQKSEERYRLLMDSASDAILLADLHGNLIGVNQKTESLLGYSREELIGLHISRIHPPEVLAAIQHHFENIALHNFGPSIESLVLRKDGTSYPVEITGSRLELNGEQIAQGIFRDIRDRKQAEQALRQSRDLLEAVFNESADALFLVDPETLLTIDCNQRAIELFEVEEKSALIGISGHTLQHQPFSDSELEKIRIDLEKDGFWSREIEYLTHQGKVFWGNIAAKPILVAERWLNLVRVTDIDHRKQAELALQESQHLIQKIADSSPHILYLYDLQEQRNIYANKEITSTLGYTPEAIQAMGSNFAQNLLHPEDFHIVLPAHDAQVNAARDGEIIESEYRMRHASGEWRWLYSRECIFTRDASGQVKQTIGTAEDVTDRKRLEEEQNRLNAELLRATRLKDEFLANMSHELRTPLNAILGMTEGLQEEVFGPINERQFRALQTIERSGSHLLELINDILDVAKIESGHTELDRQPIDIAQLCRSSLAFIQQQVLKKGLQIEIKLPSHLPDLVIDQRRIRQVLINLLNNAVKFTPSGGRITLEVSLVSATSGSETSGSQNPENLSVSDYLRIAILDTGIGIAPENIETLFKPFIQIDSALNRQYQGTGLGLALVKRIVELHGGRVGLTSELGVGSCFTIDLPCTLGCNLSVEREDVPGVVLDLDSAAAGPPPLILLAEDNEANISTVSSYLVAKGYRLLVAKNGHEAIALAASQQPDLILMDIQMHGMDGLEATRLIRLDPKLVKIPIIALTALAMVGDREKCLRAGAQDYLTKPVRLKELVAKIQQLLMTPAG